MNARIIKKQSKENLDGKYLFGAFLCPSVDNRSSGLALVCRRAFNF
jgi:hypothetical protein